MCGICGFLHNKQLTVSHLKEMNDTLAYRGPDDSGIYIENLDKGNQIGLAQNRLSVIDLSAAGHQPMERIYNGKRYQLVYNGEIYNFKDIRKELEDVYKYRFYSDTDTEVILAAYDAWGINGINKYNGMFAFALYDYYTETLYLARDRMGVKPLYYFLYEQNIVFASELKAIYKYPYFSKNINKNALALYLCTRYITGQETIFENTYKLRPGYYIKFANGLMEEVCYWNIFERFREDDFSSSYKEAVSSLKDILIDSIERRMISDVPLGAFLSGGYDSSLITSLMKECSSDTITTFTIGFDEDKYNEAEYAESIARRLGTKHHTEYLLLEDAEKIIDDISFFFDEPMSDNSQIATMLLCKTAKKYVTVALSGDGGDELFGGYTKYEELDSYKKFRAISKLLHIGDRIFPFSSGLTLLGNKKYDLLLHLYSDEAVINSKMYVYWDYYKGLLLEGQFDESRYRESFKYTASPQMKYMLQDMITFLPDDILTKVDRASMSVSLEARTPFLDYKVVEFALSLPISYKYQRGNKKRILKDLVYMYLDENLLNRPKKGFSIPVDKWLEQDFKNLSTHYFDKEFIKRQGLFDYKIVQKMIFPYINGGRKYSSEEVWTLLMFQRWWEAWIA